MDAALTKLMRGDMQATARALGQGWAPPMSVEAGVTHVMSQLDAAAIAYARDEARGDYRGFAALHDRYDANMLLPGAEGFDAGNERQTAYLNAIMDGVTALIIGEGVSLTNQ